MNEQLKYMNILLQTACPNNVVLEDEQGQLSVMVKVPKMSYAQLGLGSSDEIHPAFVVNGKEVDCIYVSKYGNVIENGVACSLPGVDPMSKIGIYDSVEACKAKGKGWHLMTQAEFSAIALWCVKEGFLPRGNNMEGRDFRESGVYAHTYENGHTATGSGPMSWYHNGNYTGIADLNGNTSNWMGGIRFVCGELQLIPDNNAADNSVSQLGDSESWRAIDGTTGEFIKPNGKGDTPNSLKLDLITDTNKTCGWCWVTGEITNMVNNTRNDEFSNMKCAPDVCENAKLLLQAYGMLPHTINPMDYEHEKLHCRNTGEDMRVHRGGSFHDHVDSGLFFIRACDKQDHATAGIGLRCCYVDI